MAALNEGEKIKQIAVALADEINLWDADNRLHHRPRIQELVDEMCDQLMMVAIGNAPIE